MPESLSDMPQQGSSDERAGPGYRAAKWAVIILSALILLALIALVIGGISKMSGKPSHTAQESTHFALPHGSRILDMQSQPGRLLVHVRGPGGEEIEIIDIQDGHLVASVKATPPAKAEE